MLTILSSVRILYLQQQNNILRFFCCLTLHVAMSYNGQINFKNLAENAVPFYSKCVWPFYDIAK